MKEQKKDLAQETQKYALTPLMKQYYSVKAEYPDAIVLFRAGDFYETFGDDAVTASAILGITLTKRANGSASTVPLAGFPFHAVDTYLPKLVQAGQRVAICEQLEDAKQAKGLVKRGVTELITPGVSFHDNVLSGRENNFLASVFYDKKGERMGAALVDVSTGDFFVAEGSPSHIDKMLATLSPKELIYNPEQGERYTRQFSDSFYTYKLDDWAWNIQSNYDKLIRHFDVKSLKGFGIEEMKLAATAAGAILHYLEYTRHNDLSHIRGITRLEQEGYVWIDRFTTRNLELFRSQSEAGRALVDVLDHTYSPIGARMLRRWLALPLCDLAKIEERHTAVDTLLQSQVLCNDLETVLSQIGDPERIAAKVAALRVNPREIVQLGRSLAGARAIKSLIAEVEPLAKLRDAIGVEQELIDYIAHCFVSEPAIAVGKGAVIAEGVDAPLDELRALSRNGREMLNDMVARESERTGISSLKIAFNNVFGYYIEVRNAHKDKVPEDWIRKQTLVSAERYITAELKEYEDKILTAQARIEEIENRILSEVITRLQPHLAQIASTSNALAQIDVLMSFAQISLRNNYCKPQMNEGDVIDISAGRHPVIEQCLPLGESYIPNDLYLDSSTQQIVIITGPNMSGKSALLRQTALITIMAQIGCFVPASKAKLGVVDRVFTRVGASDNISQGESTFMVEMLESANILNNLTNRSLILLDEIGRGTSTYDGLSIAWSMVEFIHAVPGARTLFATHYHELNELEERFERIKNFHVTVREVANRVIFLRKLVRGGTEHSFGIHVASMAGMPKEVVERAGQILRSLEAQREAISATEDVAKPKKKKSSNVDPKAIPAIQQLSIFQLDDPTVSQIRDQIKELDIDNLTPRQALDKLYEIKRLSGL